MHTVIGFKTVNDLTYLMSQQLLEISNRERIADEFALPIG